MTDVSKLSEEKIAILKQFKESIKDCHLVDGSDDYLLKWLVARNFNLMQAEKMLRTSLEWRKANRIDDIGIHWQPPVVLLKYYPMGVCGRDKFSCPVWINAFGRTDWKGVLQSVSKRDFLRYISYMAETSIDEMRQNSLKTGKVVTYQTFIIDMEHLSMRQMAFKPVREVGIEATKMSEANYPESLRKVFVINAPKTFTVAFTMIKPLLHQATLNKISVFGTDKTIWSAALLEEIDADQLPAFYGGTLTDPDGNPQCPSKFNMGGEVPENYYINKTKPKSKSGMVSLTLASGSQNKIEFNIKILNSVLKWEFMTEEGDIGFHVYYILDGEKMDLVPSERVDSHLMMEEGEVVCSHCCTYVVKFDNSFSYLRSKKIWYTIVVDPPKGTLDAPYEEFTRL